ncbi:MAG: YcaO-like family protein [Clostridia bacterium]|nr:YcaO-like family protein [Clostridia bacterium]
MQHIDLKFKDSNPTETVEKIKNILNGLDIQVEESWNASGVTNCCSLNVHVAKGIPRTNGKGVTPELAQASGYAEFIERIQSGVYLVSYQSIHRDKEFNFHAYAPDCKYLTVDELVENGDWMDPIIQTYTGRPLSREMLAKYCHNLALSEDGKVLTVPFYSLFEDKYVYLPAKYVECMYSANGNCAGNTREEAWVHALSEMMERYACQKMLLSGAGAPRIPEETLQQFPTVAKILNQVRADGNYDVTVFNYSIGNGFPIISTRIIDKNTQKYHVNVAADPVLEIAIQRTLTETFQGRGLDRLNARHAGQILNKITDFPLGCNLKNQLQSSDGVYTADYFADEVTCKQDVAVLHDNSNKSNKELLRYMLDLYRQLGKPVYVRNYSFLGFQSYKFVVPGFSETNIMDLYNTISLYVLGDSVHAAFRNPEAASDEDLSFMLQISESTRNFYGRYNVYSVNAGIPIAGSKNKILSALVRAYSCYRLGRYSDARKHTAYLVSNCFEENDIAYFKCVNKYLTLKESGVSEEKIRSILYKFFRAETSNQLYAQLDQQKSPYEPYMIRCDQHNCSSCKYREDCCYHSLKEITMKIGGVYGKFVDGQNREVFQIT